MIRCYCYPLYPTKAQRAVLASWLEVCRQLYNAALQERRDAWRMQRTSVNYFNQSRELAELRAEDTSIEAVSFEVERSALRRVDRAYQAFFRRCKSKGEPGHPRFKGRDRYNSFNVSMNERNFRIMGNRVRLPKIGWIKFHRYRDLGGPAREVHVVRTAKGWAVSFVCDMGPAPEKVSIKTAVGIDLGLTSFVTLSTGEDIDNPRYFKKAEGIIARRQRALQRKRRGSNGRLRSKRLVGAAHEHVRNQRLDFCRKLAVWLFANYDLVAHEDLNIKGLAGGVLSKSVNDAAWGVLLRCLASKAEEAGKWDVGVDPRGTTTECSGCHEDTPMTLKERVHRCACGLVLPRDHNSALVILARGARAVGLAKVPKGTAPLYQTFGTEAPSILSLTRQ